MFDKVAVIGEGDQVFAFRAIGAKVFSPKSQEEVKEIIETLQKENFGLCFLHESFLEDLKKEDLGEKIYPVVIGFSDYRKITSYLRETLKDLAVKATGSDSLVKKRDKDEAR